MPNCVRLVLLMSLYLHWDGSSVVGNGEPSSLDYDSNTVVSLMVMLPLSEDAINQSQAWERGQEILPGAMVAVDQINNSSKLLHNCTLRVYPVCIDLCIEDAFSSNINATIPFIDMVNGVGRTSNILGMVGGPFCPELLRKIVSPIASRVLFQLSGSTAVTAHASTKKYENSINFITPSVKVYYEAVYAMMQEFHWESLFLIANSFNDTISIKGSDNLNITFREFSSDLYPLFQDLRISSKKIVFVSVGLADAGAILCYAHSRSLIYPHYVWIFHDLTPSALVEHNTDCGADVMQEALQHVFFLRFPFKQNSPKTEIVSGYSYQSYYSDYIAQLSGQHKPNVYANVLYDAVWAFALTLNASLSRSDISLPDFLRTRGKQSLVGEMNKVVSNVSFEGATGSIDLSHSEVNGVVEIMLCVNSSTIPVGTYSWTKGSIVLNHSLVTDVTSDKHACHFTLIPFSLAISLATFMILCLVMTTVILGLFIYFRNEADIKASSPPLSYIMFLGCYLLFGSTLLHSVTGAFVVEGEVAVHSLCGAKIIGNIVGINLIFTTMLLRLLRIYRVFSYFGKTGKIWSDQIMALAVLLVVMVDVAIILVWSSVDNYRSKEFSFYHPFSDPPFYEIRQFCYSQYLSVWLGMLLGKLGILFVIVIFLAFKTRKIRRSNFKDTKKVNIFIFLTIMVVVLPMTLFFLLQSTRNVKGTYLTVYIVFGLAGVLCQLFLFVPKVTSPILKTYGYEVTYSRQKRRRTISKCASEPSFKHISFRDAVMRHNS